MSGSSSSSPGTLASLPLHAQAEGIRRGDFSAAALLDDCLQRIRLGAVVGAFLHVGDDAARATADAIDARRAKGEPLGPLAGVPIALKDSLCTVDAPTTAGSRMLEGYRPAYDATVVEQLRQAGAVLIGKTNLDEFGMGSSTEHSAYHRTLNPWDFARVPGGSSGGSAAAVAARMCAAALGSDTGGSVRQPAAFTGVVGVKPTYGRVSRYGLVAYASSLDQVGSLASDVRGAARLLQVVAGHDPRDASTQPLAVHDWEGGLHEGVRGLRVGVLREWLDAVHDPALAERLHRGLDALADAGAVLEDVRWPEAEHAVATYYVIAPAEASANLARFDGLRFGLAGEGRTLRERVEDARSRGFGEEVKRRILTGSFVLSAGYRDAYYGAAQRVRAQLRHTARDLLARHDLLYGPVTPAPAFELGAHTGDALSMYHADLFTLPASLAGLPAGSVPLGTIHGESPASEPLGWSLPAAAQLIGRDWDEGTLLRALLVLEEAFPPIAAPLEQQLKLKNVR